MRGHATYATGRSLGFAATARAAVLLAVSAPSADRTQLARIDDVTEFHL